jgi:hypothetical protein
MKKIALLFIVLTSSIFCTEKIEDPIKEKVISAVKSKMKNPDSFEFVSYEVIKKGTFKDAKIGLPITKEMITISQGVEKQLYQKEYDFINSGKNEDEIAYFNTYLTAKGTNSFGAIIQSKYYVKVLNNENLDVTVVKEK